MKKSLLIAMGLALLSTSAYATKSRMSALGQNEDRGSHYINDTRSVFRNAAHVNTMNNYVVTEWGDSTGATANTENAEGGFFRSAGAFAYGVYYASDLDDQNGIRNTVSTGNYAGTSIQTGSSSLLSRTNEVDLFFGGDMGVQWGVHVQYSKQSDDGNVATAKKAEQSGMGLGAGVVMGDLEAYANLTLKDESENEVNLATEGVKWEGDAMNVGANYGWGDWTFFVEYDKIGAEFTGGTGLAKNETERTTFAVGAGNTHEVSSTARVYYNISFESVKAEDKDGTTATNNQERKDTALPFAVGFEADANSWLTLRGSLSGNFLISKRETKTSAKTQKATLANTQTVSAGMTLNYGKLKVDGMIGTGESGNGTRDDITLDNFSSEIAVHYWF